MKVTYKSYAIRNMDLQNPKYILTFSGKRSCSVWGIPSDKSAFAFPNPIASLIYDKH